MHGDAFPFETTCQTIGTYGDPCEEDADCPFDAICWYDAAGLTHFDTRCVRKLSLATGTQFYYRKLNEWDDGTHMMRNGLVCQSGTAYWVTGNTGQCFEIHHMESDGYDNDPFELEAPYRCAAAGQNNKCRYFIDLEAYVNGKCECGLDGSSGYCQIPGPTEITAYYNAISPLWSEDVSNCHSQDYYDFAALAECTEIDEDTLIDYAKTEFEWKYRPFLQGETAFSCMSTYHPEASEVIRSKLASKITSSLTLVYDETNAVSYVVYGLVAMIALLM